MTAPTAALFAPRPAAELTPHTPRSSEDLQTLSSVKRLLLTSPLDLSTLPSLFFSAPLPLLAFIYSVPPSTNRRRAYSEPSSAINESGQR